MAIASLIIGIFGILGMTVAYIPLLGSVSSLNVLLALVGLGLGVWALLRKSQRVLAIIGIALCAVVIVVDGLRLAGVM